MEAIKSIDWTTVITGTIMSCITVSANFIAIRYLSKMLDKMEKNRIKKEDAKCQKQNEQQII